MQCASQLGIAEVAEAEHDAVFGVGAAPVIAQWGEFDAAGGGAGDYGRITQQDRVEATVDGEELGTIDGAKRFGYQVAAAFIGAAHAARVAS